MAFSGQGSPALHLLHCTTMVLIGSSEPRHAWTDPETERGGRGGRAAGSAGVEDDVWNCGAAGKDGSRLLSNE